MSSPAGAVFLSYAREDGEAARRIAEALRSFGLEVWMDQTELRGGDAWDKKIRAQIKQCALFLPVISQNTQNRREGYFRLEWNLAADRTRHLAAGAPFLLPIRVDEVSESQALVPDAFREIQWENLPRGLPTPAFVERVSRMLAEAGGAAAPPIAPSANPSLSPGHRIPPPSLRKRVIAAALVLVAALALTLAIRKWRAPAGADTGPAGRPVIVLMDTPFPTHVYDPATLKSGGTNADDITDVLRDLPVTIVKENTSSEWRREADVLSQHPALIVIHRSCFASVPLAQEKDLYPLFDNKLVAFLGYISSQSPRTHFLVYSRHSWEDAAVAAAWRKEAGDRFPSLAGKVETWRVPLDRATFRNPLTAQELRDSVARILHLD